MMNTIKLLFALAGLILTIRTQAQITGNPDIQKKLDAFIEVTNQQKNNEMCDLMYPKLFTYIGKQELVDMATVDNKGLTQQLTNRRITSFSTPFREVNETFVRLTYSTEIQVDITGGGLYDSHKASLGILEQFKTLYGEHNVKFNPDEKRYTILANKAMMAIQEDGKEWYLVEINTNQMGLMKALFSEAVLDALVRVN